jgi:hypothetical protein
MEMKRLKDRESRMEDGGVVGTQPAASTLLETRDGRPSRVRLRGRWLPVLDVVDAWVIQGRWWSREERRLYVRLRTILGTYDLCYREGRWELAGAVD